MNPDYKFCQEIHRKVLRLFKKCINKNRHVSLYRFSYEGKEYDINIIKRKPLICNLSKSTSTGLKTIHLKIFSAQMLLEALSLLIISDIHDF